MKSSRFNLTAAVLLTASMAFAQPIAAFPNLKVIAISPMKASAPIRMRKGGVLRSPVLLINLSVLPLTLPSGKTARGAVTLSCPAPADGVVVSLGSTNPAASVPSSVTVQPGDMSADFVITTLPVTALTSGQISATLDSVTLSAPLNVRPIGVKSLSLTPNPTPGGVSVSGVVILDSVAPTGGITVTVTSSNPDLAFPLQRTILIPAGSNIGVFAVKTLPVETQTLVKLTATANGIPKSAILTLMP